MKNETAFIYDDETLMKINSDYVVVLDLDDEIRINGVVYFVKKTEKHEDRAKMKLFMNIILEVRDDK